MNATAAAQIEKATNYTNSVRAARKAARDWMRALEAEAEAWATGAKTAATAEETAYLTEEAARRVREYAPIKDRADADLARAEYALDELKNPKYRGWVVTNRSTGTSHFLNGWNETFCGTLVSGMESENARATCGRCQRAGDAALRDGFAHKTGSPASRI